MATTVTTETVSSQEATAYSRDCEESRYGSGMLRGKSLSKAESDRVRAHLNRLVQTHGTQVAVAKLLGVSQQTVSQVLRGDAAGVVLAKRVADALSLTFDEVLGRSTPQDEPKLGSLPGWTEAEAEARRRFRYVPEAAWTAVANLRTAQPPRRLTPDWIGALASDWARVLDGDGDETDELLTTPQD